ncbi:unnamed protein product [Closterium sp. Naga37s-1]|nr:unnamed protein product [Closterium sp. Naga37s-1]
MRLKTNVTPHHRSSSQTTPCFRHAYQLNQCKEKELERQQEECLSEAAQDQPNTSPSLLTSHFRFNSYSSSSRSQSDISGSGDRSNSCDFSNTSGSKRGAAESDSDEGNNAKRHKRGRSERARKEELTGRGVRHGAKEEEAKLRRERQEQKCQKAGGKEAGQARGMSGASRESGAGGAGEGTEAGQDGRVHGAAGAGKSAADGHENARAGEGHGERQGQWKGQGQGQGQGSGGRLADGKGKNVVVQGGTLPANEEVWQQPAMVVEPSREEEFDEYFQGMFL